MCPPLLTSLGTCPLHLTALGVSHWHRYYAATNETFFYGLSSAPAEPLGIIASPTIRHPYAHAKLEHAHEALLEAIAPLLKTKGVAPTALSPPSQLVVGVA